MTDTTIIPTTAPTPAPTGVLARGTALAVGSGLVVNALLFAAGAAGAPTRVVTGAAPDGADLTFAAVAVSTVLASLVGSLALWLVEKARPGSFRAWALLAATVAAVSIPPVLRLDIDAASALTLAAMHLAVGATTIAAHAWSRRPTS